MKVAVSRAPHLQECLLGEFPMTVLSNLSSQGVTYDTGGADVKAGGHMAGMSRYSIILINYTSIILLSFCVISCPPFVTSELQ